MAKNKFERSLNENNPTARMDHSSYQWLNTENTDTNTLFIGDELLSSFGSHK